ncbi:uncharacterized protein LOC107858768 isoform X2 [Capsicum annuum]|uniref:uncharacterized protein LOC107858768 isoform X2 n=1 Tax=Capsicum annuum TaxID=4072 RepID=UPI001FB11B41|nr:uncharacterized protein LOC107858768 isoform X2 [Capsicum annuum]
MSSPSEIQRQNKRKLEEEIASVKEKEKEDSHENEVSDEGYFSDDYMVTYAGGLKMEHENREEYLRQINESEAQNYVLLKIVSVNAAVSGGIKYYITFNAKDANNADDAVKTFQALAWSGMNGANYVIFCRLKKISSSHQGDKTSLDSTDSDVEMAEWGQTRITPSGSSGCRAKRQGRRVHHRRACFGGREIIRNGVPREPQNLLRNERTIRREREKKLKEFKSFKMSPNVSVASFIQLFELKHVELENYVDISDWKALAILANSLHEPWGGRLIDVYHEIWSSEPFWMYISRLEYLWYDFYL